MGKHCSFTSKEYPQENPLWIYHYINREYVDVYKDRLGLGKEFICTKTWIGVKGRTYDGTVEMRRILGYTSK